MILVPRWYMALPKTQEEIARNSTRRRFGSPKYQKGILHPVGFWVAAATGGDNLALTALNSTTSYVSGPSVYAGIRILTSGEVHEYLSGAWTAQNAGTEWIDSFSATSASDYETKHDHLFGTTPTYSLWAENTYYACTATRQAYFFGTTSVTSTGQTYVREIADTANVVVATTTIAISAV